MSSAWAISNLDNKVHGAYMGPTRGLEDPGGPHVGPMNLAIREIVMNVCPNDQQLTLLFIAKKKCVWCE